MPQRRKQIEYEQDFLILKSILSWLKKLHRLGPDGNPSYNIIETHAFTVPLLKAGHFLSNNNHHFMFPNFKAHVRLNVAHTKKRKLCKMIKMFLVSNERTFAIIEKGK